jgi:hypothetical protein
VIARSIIMHIGMEFPTMEADCDVFHQKTSLDARRYACREETAGIPQGTPSWTEI